MTILNDLLKSASKAPSALGPSTQLVTDYIRSTQNSDGGFKGRDQNSDLYYTLFALKSLTALNADFNKQKTADYLKQFYNTAPLTLVETCSLARCLNCLNIEIPTALKANIADKLSTPPTSAYDIFLTLGCYQDINLAPPSPKDLACPLSILQKSPAGYSNTPDTPQPLTNATAAAISTKFYLNQPVSPKNINWLLNQNLPQGGFPATENLQIPDLLSTATAIHALTLTNTDLTQIANKTLDFINTLWTGNGSFSGSWTDQTPDNEYTFYALSAIGNLT